MKELNEIRAKGTPPGIDLLSTGGDTMTEWIFQIAVLGDETIYRVCLSGFTCCERGLGHAGGERSEDGRRVYGIALAR